MARSKRNTSSRTITIDFTGIKAGLFTAPEGEYNTRVELVEKGKSNNGIDQLEFTLEVVEGKFKGKKIKSWFYLNKESLWRLSGFLSSLQMEVPDDEVELDLDEMKGKTVGVVMEHHEHDGKTYSRVADHFPLDIVNDEEDDEEDEKPSKAAKKNKKAELPKMNGDEVTEMDEDELNDVIEKYELELDLSDYKTLRKMQNAVCDALEEKDMLES